MNTAIRIAFGLLVAACGVGAAGCSAPAPEGSTAASVDTDHAEHEEHGHHHAAPHDGALVALGDHVGHMELTLDSATGLLTVYFLDGEAENPVRMIDDKIEMDITGDGFSPFTATVYPVANVLAGETVGDTSEFNATLDQLVGVSSFSGTIELLTFKGLEIRGIAFSYPEGEQ